MACTATGKGTGTGTGTGTASKGPEQLADSSSPPLRWEYLQRLFWYVAKLLWSEHDGFHGMRHEVISPLSANHSRRSSTREGQSARPGC